MEIELEMYCWLLARLEYPLGFNTCLSIVVGGVLLDGARLTNVPKIRYASTISNTGTCFIEMHE